jgi:hypothetical protein
MRRASALGFVLSLSALAAGQDRRSIDGVLEVQWKAAGEKPAPPADDPTFLRRVTLDLTGSLPDPEDVRNFLKSGRKDKRSTKIEELLSSPRSAEYSAWLWIQWLMGHDIDDRDQRRLDLGALARWLKEAWTSDLSYAEMVRALLSSTGPLATAPAGNFLAKHLVPDQPPAALAGVVSRLFLGRDLRCAQCHDHPFDDVSHEDFWGFAAFFRPFHFREGALSEGPLAAPSSLRADLGELGASPRFLDGRTPEAGEPSGKALARLLLSAEGDPVESAIADRYWKLFFGQSIAPGRATKGNPELLRAVREEFRKGKGSLRALVRTLVTSRAYQLSSEGSEGARRDYAVGPIKMMNTVQFLKTWNHALALDTYYRQLYEKDPARAAFFKDPDLFWVGQTMFAKELLFPKGRDPEDSLSTGTERLALKLMNNRDLQLLMISQFGLVRKVMKATEDPARRIEELYLLMLSRLPTAREKSRLVDYVRGITNPYQAYADVFWMLFNLSEFVFVG